MERSWFSKATASKLGLLSDSSHELPRWRSPSPLTASIIPPPIVQSTYGLSPKLAARSILVERPSPLEDRQSELQADLQFLLDAQAEGLVKGLEGGAHDEHSSTGSTTPTAQSVRSASARRKTRPVRRKPGLRAARKGIYNGILALSITKDEELRAIDAEASHRDQAIAQIDEWEQRRLGLQDATRGVDESEETVRAQRLRQNADVLQDEIHAVELQLSDLKARQRKLLRQATAAENAVQAKLASYTSALSDLEADVQKFLSLKSPDSDTRPQSRDGKTSLWELPPKRRTLQLAREQWVADRDQVFDQRQSVEYEHSALKEGAALWKDTVTCVTDFEKRLQAGMSDLSSSQSAWDEDPQPPSDNNERLHALLGNLDEVLEHLQASFSLAEDRDWKLLIAAIGAELDALRRGRQILQNVLEPEAGRESDTHVSGSGTPDADGNGDAIHDLDKSFEPERQEHRQTSDSEDDPDPELLFSKHNIEHE